MLSAQAPILHHNIQSFGGIAGEMLAPTQDTKPGLVVSTRPEIRKGCAWDITLRFTSEIIRKYGLKQIYVEKPRAVVPGRDTYYLCIKVRSKLMTPRRELGFRKVAEMENDAEFTEINDQGVAVLKVKFTQRPRSVFHKHSDTMILVVALKSAKDDRVIVSDEHELVFRGGTGSVHSADARKKMILAGEIKKLEPSTPSSGLNTPSPISITPRMHEFAYLDSEESEEASAAVHVSTTAPVAAPRSDLLSQPQCEPLTVQLFENLRDDYATSTVMNSYKDEMELYQMAWLNESGSFPPAAGDAVLLPPEANNIETVVETEEQKFIYDGEADTSSVIPVVTEPPVESATEVAPVIQPTTTSYEGPQTRGRKRSMQDRENAATAAEFNDLSRSGSIPAPVVVDESSTSYSFPLPKRARYNLEDRYFQKLFFKTLPFLTLEELRSVCSQAPIPMFVKDENGFYKWANHVFCAFILDSNVENVINRRPAQFLNAQEGEEVVKSDQYLFQREPGTIQTFDLSVKCQPYKVMKMFTKLRCGTRVVVGVLGQF